MANGVAFLVDGFNVYHSLRKASKDLGSTPLKWLDLYRLCAAHLPVIGGGATLKSVYYFSAFAEWRELVDPTVIDRHKNYIEALRDSGVNTEMGRFKVKDIWCPNCKKYFKGHEEKETDVAIAAKLLELLCTNACDTAVLISGDTDLVPAIKASQRLFPKNRIVVGFPYCRFNDELRRLVPLHFKIGAKRYQAFQFANPLTLKDGRVLTKPTMW